MKTRRRSLSSSHIWIYPIALLIYIIFIFAFGCSNPKTATTVLEGDGYKNIKINGWAGPFAGGKGDWYNTSFTASKGDHVIEGVVSEGLFFKGSTIRITNVK